MDKIEKIRQEIERLKDENNNIKCDYNKAYCQGYGDAFVDLLPFLDTLSEEPDKSLEEEINRYLEPIHTSDIQFEPFTQMTRCARHFAEWQKEQMMKMITKDDNLEEAGKRYVETYFRDIDWTPDVIKSCLEEAFISGGEYVFKQIKYE